MSKPPRKTNPNHQPWCCSYHKLRLSFVFNLTYDFPNKFMFLDITCSLYCDLLHYSRIKLESGSNIFSPRRTCNLHCILSYTHDSANMLASAALYGMRSRSACNTSNATFRSQQFERCIHFQKVQNNAWILKVSTSFRWGHHIYIHTTTRFGLRRNKKIVGVNNFLAYMQTAHTHDF